MDNRKKINEQNNIVMALKKDNAELTQLNYDLMIKKITMYENKLAKYGKKEKK